MTYVNTGLMLLCVSRCLSISSLSRSTVHDGMTFCELVTTSTTCVERRAPSLAQVSPRASPSVRACVLAPIRRLTRRLQPSTRCATRTAEAQTHSRRSLCAPMVATLARIFFALLVAAHSATLVRADNAKYSLDLTGIDSGTGASNLIAVSEQWCRCCVFVTPDMSCLFIQRTL